MKSFESCRCHGQMNISNDYLRIFVTYNQCKNTNFEHLKTQYYLSYRTFKLFLDKDFRPTAAADVN